MVLNNLATFQEFSTQAKKKKRPIAMVVVNSSSSSHYKGDVSTPGAIYPCTWPAPVVTTKTCLHTWNK